MRKIIYRVSLVAVLATAVVSADAERLNFYGRDAATVGVYITNLSTGQAVEKENINMSMIPASILKSVTSATALGMLDENFRYNTDVMLHGELQGNILDGNLVVKASGDPTIESSHFLNRRGFEDMIVEALKSRNISVINGEIIVDEDMFSDTGQCPQ
ncbi:MAG: D-alanyl-D-alanine carboxypeptidase, partial [Muribaculaceae bacterium]|nr:D-alanyl-D-alanine carboxypeptidase [Muribaculaceae bacterium]